VRAYTDHTDSANKNVRGRDALSHHIGDEIGGQANDSNEGGDLQASCDKEGHAEGAVFRDGHIDDGR
jgi:hypothetical protein